MSRKPPPRALTLWLCWARAYLLACCKFGSLLIGLFEWRPGFVPLEGLPLNIAQNTLRPMFGIVQGVFRQQAGGAWFPCRDLKLAITVLMPQSSEPHNLEPTRITGCTGTCRRRRHLDRRSCSGRRGQSSKPPSEVRIQPH